MNDSKKENDELKSKHGPKPEPNIRDLMPVGETFCGLRVICTTNNAFRHAGVDGGDESEWIDEATVRAIYKAEMELRELRKMQNKTLLAKWLKRCNPVISNRF